MMNTDANPNDSFFNPLYQDVWRKLTPPGLSEAEVELIADAAGLQPGDQVLDLLCGYGRHTLPLARRGLAVTAIDNAAAYIAEIQQTAAAEELSVKAVAKSVLTAPFPTGCKAALCMGNSFAFFHREQALSLLRKTAAALVPGGVLVIDSWMVAEVAIKHFREKEWMAVDGYKYLLDYTFRLQPSRIESEHTLVCADGSVHTLQGVDYIFTLSELEDLFGQAGFATTGLYATPRKRPFRMGDNRIYIVATLRA